MKRRKKRTRAAVLVLSGLLLLLLAAAGLFLWRTGHREPDRIPVIEEPETDESSTEEGSQEGPAQQETTYPEPEYPFVTEEVTLTIPGISREYTIAWVSDLHLVTDHEAGDALGDVHAEYLDAVAGRYEGLAVTADGVHAEELWPEIIKYLNHHDLDGVIFGGDIMDYCSNSNAAAVKAGLDDLRIPHIYIRADHDYGAYYGGVFFTETEARAIHQTIDRDEIAYKFWDKNDFIVLGIDNSTKDMPEYHLNLVADVYSRGKPVIMATHVPYEPRTEDKETLAALSMQVRGTIYYWSGESDHFRPNDITQQYLDLIYDEDTIVEQVLSGHLHAGWDGMLTPQVPQHIFSPAFSGSIGLIHIVPEG